MNDLFLRGFVRESNRIEGILREPQTSELTAHRTLLALDSIQINDVSNFVNAVAGAPLRDKFGMNVQVGQHLPPKGGPQIVESFRVILMDMHRSEHSPWETHNIYETLHPYMDGNGRSGRALWLWQMVRDRNRLYELGFLHAFYYQTLQESR